MISALPGEKTPYSSWPEQVEGLARSPRACAAWPCSIHQTARSRMSQWWMRARWSWCAAVGVEVVTSAELIQFFEARWNAGQLETHLEAGRRVDRVREAAFAWCWSGCATTPSHRARHEGFRPRRIHAGGHGDRSRAHRRASTATPRIRTTSPPPNRTPDPRRRPAAARSLGQTRPAGRRLLRHHLDPLPGRQSTRRHAPRLRNRDGRARRRHPPRHRSSSGGAELCTATRWTMPHAASSRAAVTANSSPTARGTPSARRCTATAPTWITSRTTTTGACPPGRASRSSPACTFPSSACARRSTCSSGMSTPRVTGADPAPIDPRLMPPRRWPRWQRWSRLRPTVTGSI